MKTKTILIAIIATTLFSINSFAQKTGTSGNCVAQGKIIIDPFYGYPYFNGALVKGLANDPGKIKSYCAGGKVEFLLSDKIGLGAEFTYADASMKFNVQDTLFVTRTYTAGISKIRVIGRMNFHFATTSSIDPYFVIGAGYKKTTWYDDEPGIHSLSLNVIPVAFRVGVGLHYYFTDFMGINAELGLGGPMMHIGLSFKF
jgi:opacity protein-like surface antigen